MPRRKAAQNCKIMPWLSSRIDNSEGRYIQVGNSLMLSRRDKSSGIEVNPFVRLSASAKILYLSMAMESAGRKEFTFPQAAAKKYGLAPSTFRRNVKELIDAGMIQKKSCGRITREANEYLFVWDWKKPP